MYNELIENCYKLFHNAKLCVNLTPISFRIINLKAIVSLKSDSTEILRIFYLQLKKIYFLKIFITSYSIQGHKLVGIADGQIIGK